MSSLQIFLLNPQSVTMNKRANPASVYKTQERGAMMSGNWNDRRHFHLFWLDGVKGDPDG